VGANGANGGAVGGVVGTAVDGSAGFEVGVGAAVGIEVGLDIEVEYGSDMSAVMRTAVTGATCLAGIAVMVWCGSPICSAPWVSIADDRFTG